MANSYFPTSDPKLQLFVTNYKEKIPNHATPLGMTPAEVQEDQANCDAVAAAINNVNDKRQMLNSALTARDEVIAMQGGALRASISRHKTATSYTDAIGEDLAIVGHATTIDTAGYKAQISTELFGGQIRVKFKKKSADGVNLYHRKKGTANWSFLARATKSPFQHHLVLEVSTQPEHWEYRAFGVINDAEIGQASDIVEIIFGL
jgi:hypothetical protein